MKKILFANLFLIFGNANAVERPFSEQEIIKIQSTYEDVRHIDFTIIPVQRFTFVGGSNVQETGFVVHQDITTGEYFIRRSSVRNNHSGGLWVKGSMSRVTELLPDLKQFVFFQRESVYFKDTIWDFKTQCAKEEKAGTEYLVCRVWRKRLNESVYRVVHETEIYERVSLFEF